MEPRRHRSSIEQESKQIRKPGGGRKTNIQKEFEQTLGMKTRLMESFFRKAEELVDSNPAEARQCLNEARTLQKEIAEMEKPEKPKEKTIDKKSGIPDPHKDNTYSIFTRMHIDDVTGKKKVTGRYNLRTKEWENVEDEKSLLRRKRNNKEMTGK